MFLPERCSYFAMGYHAPKAPPVVGRKSDDLLPTRSERVFMSGFVAEAEPSPFRCDSHVTSPFV
jgi:hypothetical protein